MLIEMRDIIYCAFFSIVNNEKKKELIYKETINKIETRWLMLEICLKIKKKKKKKSFS